MGLIYCRDNDGVGSFRGIKEIRKEGREERESKC